MAPDELFQDLPEETELKTYEVDPISTEAADLDNDMDGAFDDEASSSPVADGGDKNARLENIKPSEQAGGE